MHSDHTTVSRRSFLGTAAGLAAAATLAGCGSNTGRNSKAGTIRQWYHQYGEAGTQQAAERFAKAYTDATVQVQWTPGDYNSKLSSGLLSGSGPDVFEWQLNVDMVRGKQIVPLDDLFSDVADDFTDATRQLATVDGKVYGIPMIEDMQLLYYRKSMLSKAGVLVPSTVDELVDAAKALTDKKVKGLFAGNDGGVGVLGGPALWSVGLDYLTEDNKVGFDDPAAAAALGTLRKLFTSGSMLLGAPADWSDPSAFLQGLTAMQWTGLWVMPAVQKAFGDDFGVAAWPAAAGGKPSVPVGTWNAMVSAKSKDVDAAKEYVKWLWIEKKDYQRDWALDFGFHIPPRKSIATSSTELRDGAAADAVKLATDNAKPAGPPNWTPRMSTAYSDALSNVIRKGSDPAKELKTAAGVVSAELKRLYG